MKAIKVDDYYSDADKKRDIAQIELMFSKRQNLKVHLDGTKMIDTLVSNNKMTHWSVRKSQMKRRNDAVQ